MRNSWPDSKSFSILVSKNSILLLWMTLEDSALGLGLGDSVLCLQMSLENSAQKVSQVHQSSMCAICESK